MPYFPPPSSGSSNKIEDANSELAIADAATFGNGSAILIDKMGGTQSQLHAPNDFFIYANTRLDASGDYTPAIYMQGGLLDLLSSPSGRIKFLVGTEGLKVQNADFSGSEETGAGGTFTSQDGKTITVTHGLITGIV